MHRISGILCTLMLLGGALFAQTTRVYSDPEIAFQEARHWISEGKHNLAYPILQELQQKRHVQPSAFSEERISWIQFHAIECELHLLLPSAETDARSFLSEKHHAHLHRMMYYHLGHYYHLQQDYEKALDCFAGSGKESLTNEQLGNLKFEQAYALFNQKDFIKALPLFEEVMQTQKHPYFVAAHYYAGFIYFSQHMLQQALSAFEVALGASEYNAVLPYYIAEIYYEQGEKDQALAYGDSVLSAGAVNYYEKDLQLLVGQIYFEKQVYDKALPFIESFVTKSGKVTREVMYELSFCYYKGGKTDKAIAGFRQLSNEKDSLGQSSMYLLGTLYLNIGDKPNARNAFQYCASVHVNADQQQSARLNYAKLSGELGFQDMALQEMRLFVKDYPSSPLSAEARELLFNLLAATNNYADGIELYQSLNNPPDNLRKLYPQLLFGRAVQLINDQQLVQADTLLGSILASPQAGNLGAYARYWKGEIAYREKRFEPAIKYLASFVQSNPKELGEANLTNGKYTLAYSYFQNDNYKSALDLFMGLSSNANAGSPPLNRDAFLRSADCSFMLRDYSSAGKKYDIVASWNSAQTDYALYQKAMIAGIKNAPEKIRLLNDLRNRFPESRLKFDMVMEIAQTLVAEKRFDESISYLSELQNNSEAQRHKPAVSQLLGVVYYNLDQSDKALQSYRDLFGNYPRSDEAKDALPSVRQLFMDQGNMDGYFQFIATYGLNLGVNEADSLQFASSYLYYVSGNYDKAIPGFVRYTSLYTTGVRITDAYYYLGQCYLKKNDTLQAIAAFQKNHASGKSDFYEMATLELARLYYFQKKMYDSALAYFQVLYDNASDNENKLEGLRGLVRCYYRLGNYGDAFDKVDQLLHSSGVSADDKVVAWMVLAKSRQAEGKCDSALQTYKNIINISQSYWGAEARYESARCLFKNEKWKAAEKMAMSVIHETGSYDYWVTRAYLLLGDIFMRQKDYFNAKATFESLSKNAADTEVRNEARRKYEDALLLESRNGKLKN